MAIHRYIKKPVIREAVQWKGSNLTEVLEFAGGLASNVNDNIILSTAVGDMTITLGNYLVKEIDGSIRPYDADVFKKSFESID